MPKTGFSTPKLFDFGGDLKKNWYVGFRYTDPRTYERKPFQFRLGINYKKTKSERTEEGKLGIKMLNELLLDGWNPNECEPTEYLKKKAEPKQLQLKNYPLPEALEYAFTHKCHLAKKSVETYKAIKNYAVIAAKEIFPTIPVCDIERPHVKRLLDRVASIRQSEYDKRKKGEVFTGNNYNKYKRLLSTLFAVLEEDGAIKYNPCFKISKRPEIRTNVHRHATVEEERIIKEEIRIKKPRLYVLMAIEELAGIRPKEIMSLKKQDIRIQQKTIVLDSKDSKTRDRRLVPIPNTLLPILDLLELGKMPDNHFVFSTGLNPGPKKIERSNTPTFYYKKIVKDALGIDVSLYSFKGLGADKRIDAGIGKDVVSRGLGHTTTKTTDIYLERESERQRRALIEYTPEF